MDGGDGALQCRVNERGAVTLHSSDHFHGKLQQRGDDTVLQPHVSHFKDAPVAQRVHFRFNKTEVQLK